MGGGILIFFLVVIPDNPTILENKIIEIRGGSYAGTPYQHVNITCF